MIKKFTFWTVTVSAKNTKIPDGENYMCEFETVEEMKECLKELKEMGQDMNYVNVFPPNTGFYGSDFLL